MLLGDIKRNKGCEGVQLGLFSNYSIKTLASPSFLKIGKLFKFVIDTRRQIQIFEPRYKRIVDSLMLERQECTR